MWRFSILLFSILAALPAESFAGLGLFDKRPAHEQREDISQKSKEILAELYRTEPQARASVQGAYGYATFSNLGVKIFVAGSGTGRGVAINNRTNQKTYMKMIEVQAGLGLGVKTFKLIWVFETKQGFDQFVNSGWELGAQASAAAKYNDTGGSYQGAIAVAKGVWLYQLTDKGLAIELTAKGTKYFKDKKLEGSEPGL